MDPYHLRNDLPRQVLELLDSPTGDRTGETAAILREIGRHDLVTELEVGASEFATRLRSA